MTSVPDIPTVTPSLGRDYHQCPNVFSCCRKLVPGSLHAVNIAHVSDVVYEATPYFSASKLMENNVLSTLLLLRLTPDFLRHELQL